MAEVSGFNGVLGGELREAVENDHEKFLMLTFFPWIALICYALSATTKRSYLQVGPLWRRWYRKGERQSAH